MFGLFRKSAPVVTVEAEAGARLKAAEQVLAGNPADPRGLRKKGRALFLLTRYCRAKRYDEARTCFEALSASGSADMVAGHHRALILALEGRGEEAAEVARELTALAPSNADEWYAKGFAMLMLKRADEGRECLEKALSLDPTHAWALNDLSGLKERHADALALLETGLKAHPNDPELLYNKACNQLWMGNPKGCLTTLSRLVEVAPKDAEAWILQGETLHAMERFQEAVEALQRGLGLDPKSAKGWSTAGQALCDMGELERGLDCFEKAVGLLPDDGGLWHDKGRAHGLMKDYKRATECFERCLELDPDNEDARELLTACRAAGF